MNNPDSETEGINSSCLEREISWFQSVLKSRISSYFEEQHFFTQQGILLTGHVSEFEPRLSRALRVNPKYRLEIAG